MFARKMVQSPLICSKIFLFYYILTYLMTMGTRVPAKLHNHLILFFFPQLRTFIKTPCLVRNLPNFPDTVRACACGLAVTV